jgi:hypothetical protein
MTRQEMISQLIDDDARTVRSNRQWLDSLMRIGFPGYDNMTDEELLAELGKRNLLTETEKKP